MLKISLALLFLIVGIAAASAHSVVASHITCRMVRDYVARVGLDHAKQVADAHGITPSEKRRARRCLTTGM